MKNKVTTYVRGMAVAGITVGMVGTAGANLTISEVDLVGNTVELVNTGTNSVNAASWQWCNLKNGSPAYSAVSGSTIDTNLSTATSLNVGPGEILVLDISAGTLPDGNGELGLYNSSSFGSASAIEDYILWGANGVRDSVAQAAGIWNDNEFIDVSGIGAGETLQLKGGFPGNQASDYEILPGTLGVVQSPPPSFISLVIADTAGLGFLSVSGTVYKLEATTDLVNTNSWQDVGTTIVGTGGTNYFYDPTVSTGVSTQRFYRIVVE